MYVINRYEEAVTAFGQEENLTELVRLLLLNGAAQVRAVPVAAESGYDAAFNLLAAEENVALVVCDRTDGAGQPEPAGRRGRGAPTGPPRCTGGWASRSSAASARSSIVRWRLPRSCSNNSRRAGTPSRTA